MAPLTWLQRVWALYMLICLQEVWSTSQERAHQLILVSWAAHPTTSSPSLLQWKIHRIDLVAGDTQGNLTTSSSSNSIAGTQTTSPGVYFSASDPVLVPSHDARLPGAVGAIKREVGSQRTPVEQISLVPSEGKSVPGQDFCKSLLDVHLLLCYRVISNVLEFVFIMLK